MNYNKTKQKVLDGLGFRAQGHVYTLNGTRILSVTQVIDPFLPFASLPPEVRDAVLLRGNLVHQLTAIADAGGDWQDDAIEVKLHGYILAWLAFKRDYCVVIEECEQRVFHRRYRYAGTFDRVCSLRLPPAKRGHASGAFEITRALVEIKTGDLLPQYGLQTAAYVEAVADGSGAQILRRVAVQLCDTGLYKIEEHTDPTDYEAFLAALTMQNWRLRHGY